MMPHRFVTAGNLDMERINDDLEAGSRDVQRTLDKRYTYSTFAFDFNGVTNASSTSLRQFAIRRPGTNNAVEICGLEFYVFASGGAAVTWTVSSNVTGLPTLVATCGATNLIESTLPIGSVPVPVPSSASDIQFTISGSATSTIATGRLIVHLRCDRGNQGGTYTTYIPTLIDSSSSTAGGLLDVQLAGLAAAASASAANEKDLRCCCFAVRGLAPATVRTMHLPSGVERIMGITCYVAGLASANATFTETLSGNTVNVVGTGVSGGFAVGSSSTVFTYQNDPMDITDDPILTITGAGSTNCEVAYMLVWFS